MALLTHPQPDDPKHRVTRRLWLAALLFGVGVVSASAGAAVALMMASAPLMQQPLSADEASVFNRSGLSSQRLVALPKLTRPVNVLVLGVKVLTSDLNTQPEQDLGYHALVNSFEGLSDTMLLLRFDPQTQQLTVLSLPRDTRTEIPGYGVDKLNSANAEGGPALSAEAVSNLLGGVPIDRYVRVNVQGLEKLINALGGVTLNVPKRMKYQDDSQHLYINLNPGRQRLNGAQALQFLRFRYDEYGDIGRVQRQQTMMRALKEQALNPALVTRLPRLIGVAKQNLDTNMSVEELLALVGFASSVDRDAVQMLMVPGRFSTPSEYSLSYWLVDQERLQMMVAQHFSADQVATPAATPDRLSVAIQDSTQDPQAVRRLTQALRSAGYANVFRAEPWADPIERTQIIAQQGDLASAQALRDALGVGEVLAEATGSLDSDITVRLGKDWLSQ